MERPDRATLERAAELLEQLGFEVRRIGRFGISLAADISVFEREFGVTLQPGKSLVAAVKPRNVPLAKLVDQVEVAGPPDYFGE